MGQADDDGASGAEMGAGEFWPLVPADYHL
jgi:hypothetical protein